MMFQLICVSAQYFDDRFQMFFHNHFSKETTPAAEDTAWLGGMDVLVRYCQRFFDGTTTLALSSGNESRFRCWLM
jgi:hypothetical protein